MNGPGGMGRAAPGHLPVMDQTADARLQRFVDAQADGTYAQALAELRAGRKQSHWMWFVLPQVAGLGRSSTAQHYALDGLDEARAYLAHPVLGPRLRECAAVLAALPVHDPVRSWARSTPSSCARR